tara:strand:- start:1098 stop:1367 length:270 start_codon:yes stop_codon:yes gene_type:complete
MTLYTTSEVFTALEKGQKDNEHVSFTYTDAPLSVYYYPITGDDAGGRFNFYYTCCDGECGNDDYGDFATLEALREELTAYDNGDLWEEL